MYSLFSDVKKTDREKRKEHAKLWSEAGLDTLYDRFLQVSEILNFDLNWLSLTEMFTALSLSVDFELGLREFDTFNLEFKLDLPSLDELLKGIWTHIEPLTVDDVYRDFKKFYEGIELPIDFTLDYTNTVNEFLKRKIPRGGVEFARYGISRYDESVYAPEGATEKYPNTLVPLIKSSSRPKHIVEMLKAYGIKEEVIDAYLNRITLLQKSLENGFFLGFNILGFSKFPPREGEYAVIKITDEVKLKIKTLDQAFMGFILGVSRLGVDRFTSRKTSIFTRRAGYFAYFRALLQKRRFVSPLSILVHKEKYFGMREVARSRRALRYGMMRNIQYLIRGMIKNYLKNKITDPFELNKYVLAGTEIAFKDYTRHKGIRSWKLRYTDEEFKQMWLEKWVAMGLNRNILEEIYGKVILWKDQLKRLLQKNLI